MSANLSKLTQIQAAALLSVAPRTMRDWVDAPRNPDNTYPGPALVAYYLGKVAGQGEFDDQRQRLAAAQAERVETENAIRRGELAVVAQVQDGWAEHISAARAKLLSMPTKLGPQLTNVASPNIIATAIRVEVNAALAELADWEPPEPPGDGAGEGDSSGGAPSMGAPADADRKRVGRRKPKAQ